MSVDTQNIVPEVITEFLEIAVHNILNARKIYPDTIFAKKHKYGVIVYKSVHPQLNDYISECIKAAHHLIKANLLSKFVICFNKTHNVNEECYVFDLLSIQNIFVSDPFLLQIEKILRTFCLRLNSSIGYLKPLSHDISFKIELHTTESGSAECMENPIFQNFPWYEINNDLMSQFQVLPLQSIDTEYIKLQAYILTKHCD